MDFELQIEAGSDGAVKMSRMVSYGSSMNITAPPLSHRTFVGWRGSEGIIVSDPDSITTTVTVTQAGTVTAEYLADLLVLSYRADLYGSVTGELDQWVVYGGVNSLVTAVPDEGYRFVAWSDGVIDNPRLDSSVQSAYEVIALFESIEVDTSESSATNDGGDALTPGSPDAIPDSVEVPDTSGENDEVTAFAPMTERVITMKINTARYGVSEIIVTHGALQNPQLNVYNFLGAKVATLTSLYYSEDVAHYIWDSAGIIGNYVVVASFVSASGAPQVLKQIVTVH